MKKRLFLLFLIFALLLPYFCGCKEQTTSENMKVRVLSSGKSDCIYINIDGYRILIDCADEDDLENIKSTLDNDCTEKIDLMIITHFDNDHIGSASDIIRSYPVKTLVMPDYVRHSKLTRKLFEAIEDKKAEMNTLKLKHESFFHVLDGGTEILVDPPKSDFGTDDNANSLITLITLQNGERLLFTGDAPKERLAEFLHLKRGNFVFVKLPHHGEYNSEVKKLLTEDGVRFAAVTIENKNNVEEKFWELLRFSNAEILFTNDGDAVLEYHKSEFNFFQEKTK